MTSHSTPATQQEAQTFKGKNRRATNRYPVKTLMQYRISGSELESDWQGGRTLDMSAGGILINIPEAASLDSRLELLIDWPGLYHGKPMVHLVLVGSVVRHDHRGTAIRIVSHEFRPVRPGVVTSRRTERNFAAA
jgi:PilZ domain